MTKDPLFLEDLALDDRAALERRLIERRKGRVSKQLIQPRAPDVPLPLSYSQLRLWFIYALAPESTAYHVVESFRILGSLDVRSLSQAIADVVARHETLRSTFPTVRRTPRVSLDDVVSPGLTVVDMTAGNSAAREGGALEILDREASRPFDLEHAPPFRAFLLRVDPDHHLLVYVLHHIACDEWSLRNLHREIEEAYCAYHAGRQPTLPNLPVQYADFALWEREQNEAGAYDAALAYWRKSLVGLSSSFSLPYDRPKRVDLAASNRRRWKIDPQVSQALDRLALEAGTTPFVMTLACFMALLQSLTGSNELVVGTPIAGRPRPELANLIGFFANTLILRVDGSGDPSFRDFLDRVKHCVLEGMANQDAPFARVIEENSPVRTSTKAPFVNILFTHRSAIATPLALPDLVTSRVTAERQHAKCDLYLSIVDEDDGSRWATLIYDQQRFEQSSMESFGKDLDSILQTVSSAQDARLSEMRRNSLERPRRTDTRSVLGSSVDASGGRSQASSPDAPAALTSTEMRMQDVWKRVLRIQAVGPNDNFFDLGGHSLMGLRLLAEIDNEFGVSLPVALLFEAPTIALLVEAIERGISPAPERHVIPLQPHGQKPPIFAPAPGGNSVIIYASLVKYLGPDQPFYGLEHPGLNSGEILERIEDIAAVFLDEIRQVRSHGSCILFGTCSGGVVALELAQRLAAEGKPVRHLIVVDPPNLNQEPSRAARRRRRTQILVRFYLERFVGNLREFWDADLAERRRFVRVKLSTFIYGSWMRMFSERVTQAQVYDAAAVALQQYHASPYGGPVTLILSERHVKGWAEICSGSPEIFRISKPLTKLFHQPTDPEIGELIRLALDRSK